MDTTPIILYWMHNHPEMFEREFTNMELATIVLAAVGVAVIPVVVAVIVNYYLTRYEQ